MKRILVRLQEMAVLNLEQFINNLEERIKGAIQKGKIRDEATMAELEEVIDDAVGDIFKINDTSIEYPFAILDSEKKALIFDGRTEHYNRLIKFLQSQGNKKADGAYKFIRNVQYVAEDVLEKWINSACNDVLKNRVLADKLTKFFGTLSSFSHIVQNTFINLYKKL
jgi:flagellar biosynthesis chaperone FliJ